MRKRKYSKKWTDWEDEIWWWEGDEWRRQVKRRGFVVWRWEDSGLGDEVGVLVSECRWGWKWKNYVPSRLWDKETPSAVVG